MLLNSGPSSFSSSTDISDQVVLYPFDSNSEAQRLYWAGRLRVSIDLLLMKNHQSQLDLVLPPYQSLRHRSRSLFNILQDDQPPATQVVSEEEHRLFAVNPKRPNRRPPQLVTKVGNKKIKSERAKRGPAERERAQPSQKNNRILVAI